MSRNIVLVCLDTVRKDYFDKYSGNLSSLSDISFSECRTASSWSVPSHASMFTGVLPHKHGVHTYSPKFTPISIEDTFLSELPTHTTIGVSANSYASPIFNFDELFDEFQYFSPSIRDPDALTPGEFFHDSKDGCNIEFLKRSLKHDKPIGSLTNGIFKKAENLFVKLPVPKPYDDGCSTALTEIKKQIQSVDEPVFIFANIMDAHGPLRSILQYDRSIYQVPNSYDSRKLDPLSINLDQRYDEVEEDIDLYKQLYAAAIDYLDRQISEFICNLQESTERETTFIISSDHGEQLLEGNFRKRFGHITPDLTEELLHVPLEIINAPENFTANQNEMFSQLWLGDLILSLSTNTEFNQPTEDIAAEVAGIGVSNMPTDHDDFDKWDRTVRCIYSSGNKYIWDSDGHEWCTRVADPPANNEREIDCGTIPPMQTTNIFSNTIDEFAERARSQSESIELNAATEDRLEDLGYL